MITHDCLQSSDVSLDSSDCTYYGVRIVTGKTPGGGTYATDIYLVLVGSKGSTQELSLQGWLKALFDNLKTATYDDIVVEVAEGHHLGDVQVSSFCLLPQSILLCVR